MFKDALGTIATLFQPLLATLWTLAKRPRPGTDKEKRVKRPNPLSTSPISCCFQTLLCTMRLTNNVKEEVMSFTKGKATGVT